MPPDKAEQADALVGEWKRQSAGRLTVFLGAAPGVGKTYAMLARAHELSKQGVNVVIGIVETHGRTETQAMTEGLLQLPRRKILYQGRSFDEMDSDAVLTAAPSVVLVDELAHRNIPGSRHERRWQDVKEFLDVGIDVYTTLNVQHIESLNDVVCQITGIRVTETVPDALFERLRDIRLVDLPTRELIERLNQGKVYLPEHATHALHAFFTPSNLTALRELAMQTVAEHVDIDLRKTYVAKGLDHSFIERHVLIAIDGKGQSDYLVRAGARIAERRGASWSVVTVDTARMSEAEAHHTQQQAEINNAFMLAKRLGGETATLHSDDVAQALLDVANAKGARVIVIGRTRQRPIARIFNRTLTQQLLRRGSHYELTIIGTPEVKKKHRHGWPKLRLFRGEPLLIVCATVGAIVSAIAADHFLGLRDSSAVFLVAVLLVASKTRMTAAVMTAVLCFFAYDFLFIEPYFTLHIGSQTGLATATIFMAAALITGQLASRLRMQVMSLRIANTQTTAIQRLARQLSTAADLGQVIAAGAVNLQACLHAQAWLRINNATGSRPHDVTLTDKDDIAANWTQLHGQISGRFTDTLSNSEWYFLPIRDNTSTIGVVGLRFPLDQSGLSVEQRRLAENMTEDIAQAAVRTCLVAELEVVRVTAETERLRSALLSSVSHDLRSPLAAMIGSADSLMRYGKDMGDDDRLTLLETIRVEGERLDRYIQNLLDMTKLGQQGLTLERDWIGVDELIGSAILRLKHQDPQVRVITTIDPRISLIHVHPALVEQAIFNVMENALKFSPVGEPISIDVTTTQSNAIRIDISDRGPGIPDSDKHKIFDMFYSVERGDRASQSTGLGLTIVQGIIGAHMGQVEALTGPEQRGTCIRLTLPLSEQPIAETEDHE